MVEQHRMVNSPRGRLFGNGPPAPAVDYNTDIFLEQVADLSMPLRSDHPGINRHMFPPGTGGQITPGLPQRMIILAKPVNRSPQRMANPFSVRQPWHMACIHHRADHACSALLVLADASHVAKDGPALVPGAERPRLSPRSGRSRAMKETLGSLL